MSEFFPSILLWLLCCCPFCTERVRSKLAMFAAAMIISHCPQLEKNSSEETKGVKTKERISALLKTKHECAGQGFTFISSSLSSSSKFYVRIFCRWCGTAFPGENIQQKHKKLLFMTLEIKQSKEYFKVLHFLCCMIG